MRASDLRVGIVPASPTLTAPADRRRFVYYARRRGLKFELADPRERYDLVVLTQRADLSTWSRYRPGDTRIIYEANDSYLSIPMTDTKQMLRGVAKFVLGQSRRLQLSYRRAVQEMCQRADAVTCSTDEQRELIRPHCGNVHLILDFQEADVTARKTSYAAGRRFHFVWEGLASSGIPMGLLREILEPIAKQREIALHIVTDLIYRRYANVVGKVHTAERVQREFGRLAENVYVYEWNPLALSSIATAADMALIPIDLDNAFHRGKPENKLVLLWRLGVPTLTTATPAYLRAMQRVGLDMACHSVEEWQQRLAYYMNDEPARERAGTLGLQAANTLYSTDEMMRRWDGLMASLYGASEAWSDAVAAP